MLDSENELRHLFTHTIPHAVERAAAFTFVFGSRILLRVSDKADSLPKMAHKVEMIFPCRIQNLQQHGSLCLLHFRAIKSIKTLQNNGSRFAKRRILQIHS